MAKFSSSRMLASAGDMPSGSTAAWEFDESSIKRFAKNASSLVEHSLTIV
jgi:hypothetical protein